MLEPLLTPGRQSSEHLSAASAMGGRKSDLDRIVAYASVVPSLTKRDKWIYGSIAFFTTVSPVSYLRPAYEDKPFGLPNTSGFKWNQVAGTWIPTSYIFYSADMAFLQIRSENIIPEDLRDILEGLSKEQMRRQDWAIGLISLLSAIPLTTPLVKYPLIETDKSEYNITGNVALIIVILVANSIAHLRPLQAIVMDPKYGAPFTLYNWVQKKLEERSLAKDAILNKRAAEQKAAAIAQQKAKFISTLRTSKEFLLDSCFEIIPQYKGLLGYKIKLNDDFIRISALEGASFVKELMAYGQKASTTSCSYGLKQQAYEFFLDAVGQMGALLVLAESLGYLSNTGLTLSEMTGSDAAGWSLAGVPMWAFGVLMHMVGRDNFRDNLDFAIGYVRGEKSLSWPIKYCSKIYFGLCLLINFDIAYMTSGSANTMIRGDLEAPWGKEVTETYISISRWAYFALAFFLMPAMENYIFSRWAKYFGTEDARRIVEFDERVERINPLLSKWKDDRFEILESQVDSPTPSSPGSVNDSPPAPKPRQSWYDWFCCRKPQLEQDEDLISNATYTRMEQV